MQRLSTLGYRARKTLPRFGYRKSLQGGDSTFLTLHSKYGPYGKDIPYADYHPKSWSQVDPAHKSK